MLEYRQKKLIGWKLLARRRHQRWRHKPGLRHVPLASRPLLQLRQSTWLSCLSTGCR